MLLEVAAEDETGKKIFEVKKAYGKYYEDRFGQKPVEEFFVHKLVEENPIFIGETKVERFSFDVPPATKSLVVKAKLSSVFLSQAPQFMLNMMRHVSPDVQAAMMKPEMYDLMKPILDTWLKPMEMTQAVSKALVLKP